MLKIRRVEEAIADAYSGQQMKCPVHLSIGQEAVPVAICDQLSVQDKVYSTHRCHAHYLAKNGSIPAMIAELHGKVTGCCKGKGGSMHLVDVDQGMMGSSALVGGTIPMATGTALSIQLSGRKHVSVAFFGDGATEEGIFYESLNFAALKKLPVIFACENNLYATYSHQRARQASLEIHKRAEPFGMANAQVDGNDVEASYAAAKVAIDRARNGEGPTLIEFKTYRWRDHVGPSYDYNVGYRTKEEVDEWMTKCPITKLEKQMKDAKVVTQADLDNMEQDLKAEIVEAFNLAKAAPFPETSEIFTDIYA